MGGKISPNPFLAAIKFLVDSVREVFVGAHQNCARNGFVEKLDWLAENPLYTERFALQVGKLCRSMTNKDVADMMRISPHTVKDLDKVYMRKQIERGGMPAPEVIGVDEISTGRGRTDETLWITPLAWFSEKHHARNFAPRARNRFPLRRAVAFDFFGHE